MKMLYLLILFTFDYATVEVSCAAVTNFAKDASFWPVAVEKEDCKIGCKERPGGSMPSFVNQSASAFGMKAECRCLGIDANRCYPAFRKAGTLDISVDRNVYSSPISFCVQWKCERFCQMKFQTPGICRRYARLDSTECVCFYAVQGMLVESRPPPGAINTKYKRATEDESLGGGSDAGEGVEYSLVLRCHAVKCNEYCSFAYGNGSWAADNTTRAVGTCRFFHYKKPGEKWKEAVVAFCGCRIERWNGVPVSYRDVVQVTSQCHVIKPEQNQALVACDTRECEIFCGSRSRRSFVSCKAGAENRNWRCWSEQNTGECRNITTWPGREAPLEPTYWEWLNGIPHVQRMGCFCKKKTLSSDAPTAESLLAQPTND